MRGQLTLGCRLCMTRLGRKRVEDRKMYMTRKGMSGWTILMCKLYVMR